MSSPAAQAAAPANAVAALVAPSRGQIGISQAFHAWQKWIVVAAATFGMMSAFGVSVSVAVFLKPLETEFGWLRADISFAYALLSAGAALGGLVSGRTMDAID